MKKINVLSLFASGGIAETYFDDLGIEVKVANEISIKRSEFYKMIYPKTNMIQGDITNLETYKTVIEAANKENVNMIIGTPPCQGMSTLGKKEYYTDARNELFWSVIRAVEDVNPEYVLIENVPKFLKMKFSYKGENFSFIEILEDKFCNDYIIDSNIFNAKDFGVPQSRPRAIIRMFKRGLSWPLPQKVNKISTLRDSIGHLPSLEAGEVSDVKWHNALSASEMNIEVMKHTAEGMSAMQNTNYYPKKADGSRVKGFHNTYKRMKWDSPAPARATNNHIISGHNNVHPGYKKENGTWSDARVLTLLETIIVSSLPLNWPIGDEISDKDEKFIRLLIGEAIPPLLTKKIVETLVEK